MTIDEIKKAIRKIEISYDYNNSKNDYDIELNLTELANLIKNLQDKAIDDFVKRIDGKMPCDIYDGAEALFYIEELAEQLKAGWKNENHNKEES